MLWIIIWRRAPVVERVDEKIGRCQELGMACGRTEQIPRQLKNCVGMVGDCCAGRFVLR
jgi:hypothetical protein